MFLPEPDQPLGADILNRLNAEKFFRIAVEGDEAEGEPHWEFYGKPTDDKIIQLVFREELENIYTVQEFNTDGVPHGRYFYMPMNNPADPYNEMHHYQDGARVDKPVDHIDLGQLAKIREQMRPILIKFGFHYMAEEVAAVPVVVNTPPPAPAPPAAQKPWWKIFNP